MKRTVVLEKNDLIYNNSWIKLNAYVLAQGSVTAWPATARQMSNPVRVRLPADAKKVENETA